MHPCKRVICRLDIKGSKLIKGKRFDGLRVIGDPYEFAKFYANEGIDEIFYSDAVASLYQRNSLYDILKKTSQDIFIPITAGGGIRSVEDGKKLLLAGADKLAINTAAVNNPELINDLVNTFGSQCIVISLQVRKALKSNNWDIMIESGREKSSKSLSEWIEEVQERGAGEIILTSVDNDGTGEGTDIELIKQVSKYISIPLIVGGGIANQDHIRNILKENKNISGISIGWAFHRKEISVKEVKDKIYSSNFPMRYPTKKSFPIKKKKLKISIVDYSMGNIRSLYNCLSKINNDVIVTNDHDVLNSSDLIALPGVGSFPEGMRNLKKRGLTKLIKRLANKNRAFIGICLGMQLLFDESNEIQNCEGLGIFEGKIKRLPVELSSNEAILLPHVGWNKVHLSNKYKEFFPDINENFYQYFVHSYANYTEILDNKNTFFSAYFGNQKFNAGVKKGNIVGLQFHPERSGNVGIHLLSQIISNITSDV